MSGVRSLYRACKSAQAPVVDQNLTCIGPTSQTLQARRALLLALHKGKLARQACADLRTSNSLQPLCSELTGPLLPQKLEPRFIALRQLAAVLLALQRTSGLYTAPVSAGSASCAEASSGLETSRSCSIIQLPGTKSSGAKSFSATSSPQLEVCFSEAVRLCALAACLGLLRGVLAQGDS